MRFNLDLLVFCVALLGVNAQEVDGCPKLNIACLDIINSSQCIEGLILGKTPPTKADMEKCLDYEGASSKLPPAQRVRLDIANTQCCGRIIARKR